MHTTEFYGLTVDKRPTTVIFTYNGDYSGDAHIVVRRLMEPGEDFLAKPQNIYGAGTFRMVDGERVFEQVIQNIPIDLIRDFVAKQIRDERVMAVENLTTEQLLGLNR